MSDDLPLWTEDELDVKPEYHLTYGHIIVPDGTLVDDVIERLGYSIISSSGFTGEGLVKSSCGKFGFTAGAYMHVVSVRVGGAIVVFLDRKFFFNNAIWIELSKRWPLVVVTQQEQLDFFYRGFRDGKFALEAVREKHDVRVIGAGKASAFLGGRFLFGRTFGLKTPSETLLELVHSDCVLIEKSFGCVEVSCFSPNLEGRLPDAATLYVVCSR